MFSSPLFQRLAIAFAIGLLIGIERGWEEREGKPGSRAAGIRTHALIGLLGGIWGALSSTTGPVVLGLVFASFAATFAVFEYREVRSAGSVSATGMVAALLSFTLGAYAVLGNVAIAASAGVAATAILAERQLLHAFLERLKWTELRSALLLLVMTFVLLPVLPDHAVDPWGALNPHQLWLIVILIASLSYLGYVSVRLWGAENGLLFAGAAGALVSSTTVTWTFARMAAGKAGSDSEFSAAILVAWLVSFVRMGAIAIFVAPGLMPHLAAPLFAGSLITGAGAFLFDRRSRATDNGPALELGDPFDIFEVLKFSGLLIVVFVAATLLSRAAAGNAGLPLLAFASGLVDVDPITLSMAKIASGTTGYTYAAVVILIAAGANLLAKCVLAFAFGSWKLALPLTGVAATAALAAAAMFVAVA